MHNEEGSTLVEMGVSCALIFAVLFGVFEGCLASYTYHLVSDLAREGSRWAIVRGGQCHTYTPGLDNCGADQTAIANYVKGIAFPGIDASNRMTVTTDWYAPGSSTACPTQCNQPGNSVKVTVLYNFPLAVPFVPSSVIRIASSSRMVISQ